MTPHPYIDIQLGTLPCTEGVTESHALLSIAPAGFTLTYEEQLKALMEAFDTLRRELGAQPVFKRYFMSDAANQFPGLMNYELESPDYAVSAVQQPPAGGGKLALWAWLMTGVQTRACPGGLFEAAHGSYRHLWSGGNSIDAQGSEAQTKLLLNDYVMQLLGEGCTLEANCLRTWFFINDIDNNYPGVVGARNDVFRTQNMSDRTHFIASTGIGGRQNNPKVLVQLDNYAVAGLPRGQLRYLYAPAHLSRTSRYGVSFERGVQVDYGDRRHVFVSGTASASPQGEIMHAGDVAAQCRRVWDNIGALLAEGGTGWADVKMLICYLRDRADAPLVGRMLAERFGPSLPRLVVQAGVCRPGWLVEMECIAARPLHTAFAPL